MQIMMEMTSQGSRSQKFRQKKMTFLIAIVGGTVEEG